jgi:nicotinate dehydrogenase subunit A
VHLDGEAAYSCILPVGEVGSQPVTTLEGLADPDRLHPLQQAFLDEQAAQCGYCIPGIIMTAAAHLESNPSPTDSELRTALEGALCRCGSHARILRAIRRTIETPGED